MNGLLPVLYIRTQTPATPLKFNEMDGLVNRVSYNGKYEVINGIPRYDNVLYLYTSTCFVINVKKSDWSNWND